MVYLSVKGAVPLLEALNEEPGHYIACTIRLLLLTKKCLCLLFHGKFWSHLCAGIDILYGKCG